MKNELLKTMCHTLMVLILLVGTLTAMNVGMCRNLKIYYEQNQNAHQEQHANIKRRKGIVSDQQKKTGASTNSHKKDDQANN